MTEPSPLRLKVIMPLRDDWASAAELIRRIDKAVSPSDCIIEILLVDDASTQQCDVNDFRGIFSAVQSVISGPSPLAWSTPSKLKAATPSLSWTPTEKILRKA